MSKPTSSTYPFLLLFRAVVAIIFIAWVAFFVYQNAVQPDSKHSFKLGLDLAGGSHLVYQADTSNVDPEEVSEIMGVLRDVIENRIRKQAFGASEPIVQVEQSSFVTDEPIQRLIVELPGVTDIDEAIAEIGRTPLLEFKLLDASKLQEQQALDSLKSLATSGAQIGTVKVNGEEVSNEVDPFVDTGLTGRYLETATMEFAGGQGGQLSNEPLVSIRFNGEGAKLFGDITRANVGQQLGIFLDGELLSSPVINEAITGGTAVISGSFTPDEAQALAQNLSFGALPVAIELQGTQTVGPTLGAEVLGKGITAATFGFAFVVILMLLWYRLPGLVAIVALCGYIALMLGLFQFIPVTLTAAGLAGFILSLGMAVDANVLVFERMKEEYAKGTESREAANEGFKRAWGAIRDGNVTSLLSAIILFWFGTSLVKGFALVFGVGIVVSMFSALLITRTILVALPSVRKTDKNILSVLMGSGIKS